MKGAARGLLISLLMVGAPHFAYAGTTVITHGFAANSTMPADWTLTMAEAILAAAGDPSGCGAIGGEVRSWRRTPIFSALDQHVGWGL